MSNKKQVRIGLVGRGLMGKMHANAYKRIPNFFPDLEYQPVLQAVASRNEEKVKEFAETWGFQSYETDWRKLVERDDIDAIDICAPNNLHAEIAIAAAEAGRSEEHTSELQSRGHLVCRRLLEKKKHQNTVKRPQTKT